jgi:nicotinate phosphoribosyltransferase
VNSASLTDLYQLTMMQGYFARRMDEVAVFEMYVRRLPAERNFFIAMGLEQVLDYLGDLHFTTEEIDWLHACGYFQNDFVDYLAGLRFTGDVHALPEGTIFFPEEPLIRVTAPLAEAQLVESRIINLLHYQTLIASKAIRAVLVCPNRTLVDFGLRRAHGGEAGVLAARAAYLAGFAGSATVLAGQRFGVPVFGTMAHSYVLAHDSETEAFEHFATANPDNVVLLIDTYDTEAAARKVVQLANALQQRGIRVKGVRLDSGDLADHARQVRRILDAGGQESITIFASGNLDEYALHDFAAANAPIDGFGIGTRLTVSEDVPYLDCAYKLQEYAGRACRKRSEGKATWPGRKQVFRQYAAGKMVRDIIALDGDSEPGEPLMIPVMKNGQRLQPPLELPTLQQRTASQIATLPPALRKLEPADKFPVEISASLRELAKKVDAEIGD